jgi:hypothetical protein
LHAREEVSARGKKKKEKRKKNSLATLLITLVNLGRFRLT